YAFHLIVSAILNNPELSMRLVKGGNRCAGTVEVNRGGQWGTVMQLGWDMNDTTVVCRELGCGSAVAAPGRAHFGEGSGQELITQVTCNGSEPTLSMCPSQEAGKIPVILYHPHVLDAGVICSGPEDLRLVNGSSPCSGRVEVYRWGEWGTIAQYDWDLDDASVVCRQLGCGTAVLAPIRAHFGEGSGRVLLRDVSCSGSESALRECRSLDFRYMDIPHIFDAGVVCSDHVRLVGGADRCSGRLEVKFSKSWATVCDGNFDWQDAEVVCRELDCGAPSALHKGAHFGEGEGPIWYKGFHCEGEESFLHECCKNVWIMFGFSSDGLIWIRLIGGSHMCSGRVEIQHGRTWGSVCDTDFDWQDAEVVCRSLGCGEPAQLLGGSDCSHRQDAGVTCAGHEEVRLVKGGNRCAGTVEVNHGDTWATVCDGNFDWQDAEVVCRELDCGAPSALHKGAHFGEGEGPIWYNGFHCEGQESFLHECVTPTGPEQNCTNHTVTLTCSDGESWATVCDGNFDWQDAEVVCRQLDCGAPSALHKGAHFGEGEGPIWYNGFHCEGEESFLHECLMSDRSELNCTQDHAVGLVSHDDIRLVDGGRSPCAGTVEVNRGGQWGTIIQFGWDMNDTAVVCRELSCGSAVATPGRAHFGEGSGKELITKVSCNGSEPTLSMCPSRVATMISGSLYRPHVLDAGVICSEPADVRLVNGSSPCSGRVEVYRWGEWGTVYQRNWDMNDATVVCRQLGCGSAVSVPGAAHFGEGSGRMVLGDVSCSGSESALRECGSLDGRETIILFVIADHVRLVGGADRCSGRLEVKFSQSWATVCDGNFDWQDAEVVCRELDCGAPSALHKGAHFGEGEGPIWYKDFNCEGEESFLHECVTSVRSEQNCTQGHAVGLDVLGTQRSITMAAGEVCALMVWNNQQLQSFVTSWAVETRGQSLTQCPGFILTSMGWTLENVDPMTHHSGSVHHPPKGQMAAQKLPEQAAQVKLNSASLLFYANKFHEPCFISQSC
uniref:SRCR domain-containing protein n=1 Tax=Paramormyrops kingsleyae TaxID=1676925 RepID=A0A3B3SPE3_9TELE